VKEGEHRPPTKTTIEFGQPPKKGGRQRLLFPDGQDLPLLSGTPQEVIDRPYIPEDHSMKQGMLPGMPPIDYDHILEKDKELRRRRRRR
jgi:hypothetical protein